MKTTTNTRHEVRILPQIDKAVGLDMHKDKIVAFRSDSESKDQQWEEYGTFTKELYRIRDWILGHEIEYCLMESTGIYWLSLYSILTDAGIKVIVANPMQVKQIPKRKTDRKDAKWLCTLLLHGLVRPSFIPTAVQSELRDFCRNRLFYTRHRSKIFNRLIKILETNNIKLRSVISSIHTKTAMDIIRLLAEGETNTEKLLGCLQGRAKSKKEQMALALEGTLSAHHRTLLSMLLEDIEQAEKQIEHLNVLIKKITREHYAEVQTCLDSISGIAEQSAQIIISEIGDNMERFPTADHLTAWCGVAPGNAESAGKRKNTATKKGNKYLRIALVSVAWAAVRTKDSYWKALFTYLRKRMNAQKAIIVIARKLLKVVFKTIRDKKLYLEKGTIHYTELLLKRRDSLTNAVVLAQQTRPDQI